MKEIKNWKLATVFDIEANGLLEEATMFHVLSFHMADGKSGSIWGDNHERFRAFCKYHIDNEIPVVAHRGILFDIPLCEKLLGMDLSKLMVIDTLAISWYLNTKRKVHGLDSFLEDYGIPKPKVGEAEWVKPIRGISVSMKKIDKDNKTLVYKYIVEPKSPDQGYIENGLDLNRLDYKYLNSLESEEDYNLRVKEHLELMKVRCEEDVKINVALWKDIMKRLHEMYTITKHCIDSGKVNPLRMSENETVYLDRYINTSTVDEYIGRCLTFLMFKMDCARLQEKTRWKADIDYLKETEKELLGMIEPAKAALEAIMPPIPVYGNRKKPEDPLKKDGTLKVSAVKWNEAIEQLGFKDHFGNPKVKTVDGDKNSLKILTSYKEPNAGSSSQLKDLFFSHGWKPETFKYVKDEDAMQAWVKGGFKKSEKPVPRMIPQISKDGEDGKELCPSLIKLAEKVPEILKYDRYTMIKHRWDTVKGFLRDVSEDGYLQASIGGFTNTLRVQHREIVNLVGVDKPYGENIRGALTCSEGEVLLGSDLSSLEDRVKHHFMLPHDPSYVETMMADDYDPHILTAHSANMITDEELEGFKKGTLSGAIKDAVAKARKGGKTTNYACLPVDNSQVLTVKGWRYYYDLKVGDTVLTYNTEKGIIEKDKILDTVFIKDQDIITMSNKHWSIESTKDHRWYGWQRRAKGHTRSGNLERYSEFGFKTTEDINSEFNIIASAPYKSVTDSNVSVEDASFVGWLLSDGYYKWSKDTKKTSSSFGKKRGIIGTIAQAQHKFYKELEDCLNKVGAEYTQHVDSTGIKTSPVNKYDLKSSWLRGFMDRVIGVRKNKHEVDWVGWILSLTDEAREGFLYSFWLADGDTKGHKFNKNMKITQNEGNICDAVLLSMYFMGNRVTNNLKQGKCRLLTQISRPHVTAQELDKKYSGVKDVFCITTNNGTFVTKQDNTITITGNCVYGGSPDAIARGGDLDISTAKLLHEGYWKLNWSVKAIAEEQCVFEDSRKQKWLINPINGIAYSLRTEKDRFSTLCQGTGSYFFDMWVDRILNVMEQKLGYKTLTGSFHDEIVLCFKDLEGMRDEMESIVLDAIDYVSDKYMLRRRLGADVQFDNRYSGIH